MRPLDGHEPVAAGLHLAACCSGCLLDVPTRVVVFGIGTNPTRRLAEAKWIGVSRGTIGGIVGENGPMGVGQTRPRGPPRNGIRALLYEGGNVLEVPAGTDAETATLV